MRFLTSTLAMSALAGLTACGGGGGTTSGGGATAPSSTEFATILSDDRAEVSRIAGSGTGIPTTAASEVPVTTGLTNYTGVGIVGIQLTSDPNGPGVLLRGDANVDVAFSANTLSGSISEIVAVDSRDQTPVLVSEDINLTNGAIQTDRRAFNLDYGGTLDVGGTDYTLGGTMAGQFRGTNAAALSAADQNGTTNSTLPTTIAVVAEQ